MIVGQQKDITRRPVNTETSGWQIRRISKALRLMKMAEKFGIPVLTLIDTRCLSRAEAEERGQGEAIARNIFEMVRLKVPIITIIVGEGASGGALGIGVGDRVYMLETLGIL
jgi:acetyl-CoA carboxylase carboxyl transferase subunit alpha